MSAQHFKKAAPSCFLVLAALLFFSGRSPSHFDDLVINFENGFRELNIPELQYDYKDYFNTIPDSQQLRKQERFFLQQQNSLQDYTKAHMAVQDRIMYAHLRYEVDLNLERIALEKQWSSVHSIPPGGLSALRESKRWYALFVKKFTGTGITPEAVMELGKQEVKRVKAEIDKIRRSSRYPDSSAFYRHLADGSFFITDKQKVLEAFAATDRTVRQHLASFTGELDLPEIFPMEWPDAGPNTPPGIYLSRSQNAYGKDVFQFNFYGGRFNKRALEWIYMHEAIPGHHLQMSLRDSARYRSTLQELFLYPGNFEGWGCYVEYYGRDLGLYKDPWSHLGKWEWDLVRSARLVIDAGIHYYGWSRKEAVRYWKATIPGQDDIAEREITRVTNWPGQALSYKVGAEHIRKMRDQWIRKHPEQPIALFHRAYLDMGMLPITIIEKFILDEDI